MNNFRAKFGQKKTFFPVIHTLSDEQVLESARIAADSGADGVFLISSVLNVLKRKTPMKKQKTPPDQLRIKLSNRRPVLITRAVWPVIAMASSRGTHEETGGEHEASIRVRQHASGRMRVVYGVCKYGEGKTVRSGRSSLTYRLTGHKLTRNARWKHVPRRCWWTSATNSDAMIWHAMSHRPAERL